MKLDVKKFMKYHATLDKKMDGKPVVMWIIQKRTLNSALHIVEDLSGKEFSDVTSIIFRNCQFFPSSIFIRKFQGQIELAVIEPDKFIINLHGFYNQIAREIKKEKELRSYFEFLFYWQDITQNTKEEEVKICNVFCDLLLQCLEYLRPDKFEVNQYIAGIRSDDTLITIKDPYPMFDLPEYELQKTVDEKRKSGHPLSGEQQMKLLFELYARHGYIINSFDDILLMNQNNRCYANNIYYMIRFINEDTIDLLPEKPLQCNANFAFPACKTQISFLKEKLQKRRRTLPRCGVISNFTNADSIKECKFKELHEDESIYLLFKVTTNGGELNGAYDTMGMRFYSAFCGSSRPDLNEDLEAFILWNYCSLVCDIEGINPYDISSSFLTIFPMCVRHYVDQKSDPDNMRVGDSKKRRNRFDKALYLQEQLGIDNYIRKLPAGQKASEQAKQLAIKLGFELKENETYVRSFKRKVYKRFSN